jgi:hypothetical protein
MKLQNAGHHVGPQWDAYTHRTSDLVLRNTTRIKIIFKNTTPKSQKTLRLRNRLTRNYSILSQFNPAHTSKPRSYKIHINVLHCAS